MKIPDSVAERMAHAAWDYQRERRPGLPHWADATEYYKAGARGEMAAGLAAAIEAGHVKLVVVG